MSLDFAKLEKEYDKFWQVHSFQSAIEKLREIDFFISGGKYDTFILPYAEIFLPMNLITYERLTGSNLTFKEIILKVSYQDLMDNFVKYLKMLIKQITDYQTKIKALNKLNAFGSIISSFASLLDLASNKFFIFAILGIYLYNKISDNK